MIWIIFIVAIQVVYIVINLMLQYGISKPLKTVTRQPAVSIIIAARNEEKNLPDCLTSISRLDYPQHLLEVLILDDHSTDATAGIARDFAGRYPHFKLLRIQTTWPGLQGKMNALAQGIRQASGEIILITDADCRVPIGWIQGFVRYFSDTVGLAGSMTLLLPATNCFARLQNLDWTFLQGIAAGTAALDLAVTVLGNNFAFRRQAYIDTGGFESIGFSIAEDMRLLQAIQQRGWKIAYPLNAQTAITSRPMAGLKEFYRQRLRWVKSGTRASWWGYALMSVSFLSHLGMLLPVFFNLLTIPVTVTIGLVLLADLVFLVRLSRRFGLGKFTVYFLPFEIFYICYTLIFAVLFFLPARVIWKGRSYK